MTQFGVNRTFKTLLIGLRVAMEQETVLRGWLGSNGTGNADKPGPDIRVTRGKVARAVFPGHSLGEWVLSGLADFSRSSRL